MTEHQTQSIKRVTACKRVTAAAFGIAALLSLAGCSDTAGPLADDQREWDVLVIVLDALPAKRLGLYGAPEAGLSPNLDRIGKLWMLQPTSAARPTVVFDQAIASAAYTLASTASLFTGLWPPAHRVLGLDSNVLDANHTTFAEVLQARGFATAALSCNPNISIEGQFDQGFDTFRHYFRDNFDHHVVPEAFVPDAGAWWRAHADQRRLLYAHLLPPHQPYTPPAPFDARFGAERVPRSEGLTPYLTELNQARDLTPGDPRVQNILARYLAGVNYADTVTQTLLDELAGPDGTGLDRTIVVITSDHGEAFAEHGLILHGGGVFDELVRVPLILQLPASIDAPDISHVAHAVSTADLAPTLCELLDVPWPTINRYNVQRQDLDDAAASTQTQIRPTNGASVWPYVIDNAPVPYPTLARSVGEFPVWGLRFDGLSLVSHRASDQTLWFNLADDPVEQRPLGSAIAQREANLDALLDALLKSAREAGTDFERANVPMLIHKDALEQLGYFEDDVTPKPPSDGNANPKEPLANEAESDQR